MPRYTTGIAVECESCGFTSGHYEEGGDVRCDECGRFATTTDDYCAKHDVRVDSLPSGYDSCPRCQQEADVAAREREMMERRANPRMHTSVDAPRF